MNVLLTNDDGINAIGLRAIYRALRAEGHNVCAVAPMRQQSGVSRSLTVFEPLRSERIEESKFSGIGVYGTPADCVKLGLAEFVAQMPDLVISGINIGRNVGPDLFYSGTVAAAAEGAHAGLISLAISRAGAMPGSDMDAVATHSVKLAEKLSSKKELSGKVVNINYPAAALADAKGPKVCPQSAAVWRNIYHKREDPRGWPYWWLIGEMEDESASADNDLALLERGYITVTPLKFEYTDSGSLQLLKDIEAD